MRRGRPTPTDICNCESIAPPLDGPARQGELPGALERFSVGGSLRWESRPPQTAVNPGTGVSEAVGQPADVLVNLMGQFDVNDRTSVQLAAAAARPPCAAHIGASAIPNSIMAGAKFRLSCLSRVSLRRTNRCNSLSRAHWDRLGGARPTERA